MTACPRCGQDTPPGNFCIRCGAHLESAAAGNLGTRSHFAAAPHEHVALPALVSSLFPHLPRTSHAGFRAALGLGTASFVVLAFAHLFPIAMIATALLLPLLVLVYLIDIDLYEEEPWWALALALGWGALAGVGFGALALSLSPSVAAVFSHGTSEYLVDQGLILPFLGLLVLLIGPLAMLRHRAFNTVLDGVTLGAAAAAAFGGGQAISYGIHLLSGGLRPVGAAMPWIWRLLALGVAMPVLTMGAGAAACAAIWLRYRAPARDSEALGPLGHPALALPLAAGLVMGGAVGEVFLPAGIWLAWLVAFDLVAIILLRRAIHVGLLEESLEVPIGPPLECPNCGVATARHTFCGHCGISLQALPKSRRSPVASPDHGAVAGSRPPLAGPKGTA